MASKHVLSWESIVGSEKSKCKGPEVKQYMVVRKARGVMDLEKRE